MKEIIFMKQLNQHNWPFLRYFKDFENVLVWVFSPWLTILIENWKDQLVGKFEFYLHINNLLYISLDIAKLLQTCYFSYFENAWPQAPKTTLSTLMFIYVEKIKLFPRFFLEILHFKESCNLIGQEHFGP